MAIKKTIIIDADAKGATKELKKVDQGVKKVDKSTSGLVNTLDRFTGGAITKIRGLVGGVKNLGTGFKALKLAIAASGIGLLLIAITGIIQAFKRTEEGQNKFAKLMGVIGSVMENVLDVIADVGEIIIGVFSGDGEAMESIKSFGKAIWNVVGLPIKNIIDAVKTAGNVLKGLWNDGVAGGMAALNKGVEDIKGNFDEAKESIDAAKQSLIEFGQEIRDDAREAARIADLRAKADKVDRELIIERAKATRDIAELREKAEQRSNFNVQERIKFLEDAAKIEEKITNKQILSAKLKRDAVVAENELADSNKEALDAAANAEAQIIQLETQRLNLNKRLTAQKESFRREAQAERDAILAARKAEIKSFEKKDVNELDVIGRAEDEKTELLIAKKIEQNRQIEEQRQIDLENERKIAREKEQLDQAVADAKYAIAGNTFALLSELAGRDSKIGKGLAVASATISGIEGVQNAYTTAQKSPVTAVFPAYPIVQAGLAGAFSALQIKKILSTDETGRSGLGGNVGGGAIAPSFNLVQGTGTNQIAQSIGQQSQPIQAYVVPHAVTSGQELDRNIEDNAGF